MPSMLRKSPPTMTVADFLAWPGDGTGRKFRLVDGEVHAMSPASHTHGRLRSALARLIGNALIERGSSCDVSTKSAVATRVRADLNMRVPDVAVTCTPDTPGEQLSTRPLVELLRRGQDGHWPEETEKIGPGGTLSFESIQFTCPLSELYARTHLGREG